MKLEREGQRVKIHGYMKGTAMWKWRTIIVGGVVVLTLGVDALVMYKASRQDTSIIPQIDEQKISDLHIKDREKFLSQRKKELMAEAASAEQIKKE